MKEIPLDVVLSKMEYDPESGKMYNKLTRKEIGHINRNYPGSAGYLSINIYGHGAFRLHRVAWAMTHMVTCVPEVDHINGNTLDNRLCNLRLAGPCGNSRNRRSWKPDRELPKGVIKLDDKYVAQCMTYRRNWRSRRFNTPEEAREAYIARIKEVHGEFARP